ncbi:helix-turn-helix transcriptional regulator [Streptomyces sp. JNUCC 64]
MTDTTLWTYQHIAAHIQVRRDTVRSYRKQGLMPPPDLIANGTPHWYADTVRAWAAARPRSRRGS